MLQNMHETNDDKDKNDRSFKGYKPVKTPPISVENEIDTWARIG